MFTIGELPWSEFKQFGYGYTTGVDTLIARFDISGRGSAEKSKKISLNVYWCPRYMAMTKMSYRLRVQSYMRTSVDECKLVAQDLWEREMVKWLVETKVSDARVVDLLNSIT